MSRHRLKRKLKELIFEDEELKVARHCKLFFSFVWSCSNTSLSNVISFYGFKAETSFASASQPEIKLLGYDDSMERVGTAPAATHRTPSSGPSLHDNQQLVTIKPKDANSETVVCILVPFFYFLF